MKSRSLFALIGVTALVLFSPVSNADDTNSVQSDSEIPNPSGLIMNQVFGRGGGGGHPGGGGGFHGGNGGHPGNGGGGFHGNPGHNPGNPGRNPGHNPGHNPGNPGHNPGNPGHNPGHNPGNPGHGGIGHGNPGHNPGHGGIGRGPGSRRPVRFHGGGYPWRHWGHRWSRPVFHFRWEGLRTVTCISADSVGYEYPVTETGYAGIGYQARLEQIEDAAMDRCYEETNGDEGCQLLTCRAGY